MRGNKRAAWAGVVSLAFAICGWANGQNAVVGYAIVDGNNGSQVPVASALFSLRVQGVLVSEAGVGAVEPIPSGRVFVDQQGTRTGLALVNPDSSPLSMTLTLRYPDGTVAAENREFLLPPRGHVSAFVDQLFESVPGDFQTGSLTFESEGGEGAAAVTIRLSVNARGEPLFATLPVVDLGETPEAASIVFPHLGAGGILTTQIVLINRSSQRARGSVRFVASNGSPLTLEVDGSSTSSLSYDLAPEGVFRANLDRSSGIAQGYAVVTAESGPVPSGTAVFQFRDAGENLLSEAGVGASRATRRARVYVDTVGTQTGVAVANLGNSGQPVEFELFDRSGISLGETTRQVAAEGHLAIFADELFPNLPPGFTGLLEIRGEFPVVPVTLKLSFNQRGDPILTTLPVADALRPPQAGRLILPQIGFGGGLATRIILINPGDATESMGVLTTMDESGAPLELPVGGETRSQVGYDLAPRGGRQLRPGNAVPPAEIVVDPSNPAFLEVAVNRGETLYLRPAVIDAEGEFRDDYELTFSSLDESVLSVDPLGRAEGLQNGFSTLTITAGGVARTAVVAVSELTSSPDGLQVEGVAPDLSGRVYLASAVSNAVLRGGDLGAPLEVFAGQAGLAGFRDDARLQALFSSPRFLAINQALGQLFVSDSDNHRIRVVGLGRAGTVSTLAGRATPGSADGDLASASFRTPTGVALDNRGNLWVADSGNHTIRRILLGRRRVETVAGQAGVRGNIDGVGPQARFNSPAGIAVETEPLARQLARALTGEPPPPVSVVIADAGNGAVRRVFEDGRVETLTSTRTAGIVRPANRAVRGQNAPLAAPEATAVDSLGTIYVSYPGEGRVEALLPNGQLAPVARSGSFSNPRGLAVGNAGSLLVADAGALRLVRYGPPVIVAVTPDRAPVAGGVRVAVTGRNFAPETIAILSGSVVTDLERNDTSSLSFTVPPLPSGRLTLTLQNRGGIAQTDFLVEPPTLADLGAGEITTVAGGSTFVGDGGPARQAALSFPQGVALDSLGNLFVADTFNHRIRRVLQSVGVINSVAGNGLADYGGDDGPATAASLNAPQGVAFDPAGNLLVVDRVNSRIRRLNRIDGTITTIVGNGTIGPFGDGGPASQASLSFPAGVVSDRTGNLFIADTGNLRVRRVDAETNIITTVAGDGFFGAAVDGLPATQSSLALPESVAVDEQGNLFISDTQHALIRRVDAETGRMTSVAGTGTPSFAGDGGPATEAALNLPGHLIFDTSGDLVFADRGNNRVRRISGGVITTVAGDGSVGFSGDGGPALEASLSSPSSVVVDGAGDLWIADSGGGRIRRVSATDGDIQTVVGNGMASIPGDGGPAFAAGLSSPFDVSFDPSGALLIVETGVNRIRRVDAENGTIETIAGTGIFGVGGGDGPASEIPLAVPVAVESNSSGDIYLTESSGHRVRRIDSQSGLITTVAGTGEQGFSGDGGPALQARFGAEAPWGLALDSRGGIYVSDTNNHRVRRIDPDTGVIETVAGNGTDGFFGDGGPASQASLSRPRELHIDDRDNLYIVDSGNHRVRRVDADSGTIETVAGGGFLDPASGAVQALDASIDPAGVAIDETGNLLVSDNAGHRIWKVDSQDGVIRLAAGSGVIGAEGDGASAAEAALCFPRGLALDGSGNLFIADRCNNRIRAVRGPLN